MPAKTNELTVAEVADELGLNASSITRHCRLGNLKARRFGRSWMILRKDLDAFVAAHPDLGTRGVKPKGGR